MDLLKQCQQWFEQDEAQKVIDTLEAIPAEERTPELDSELAKAYIAVAHIGEREPFEKALELLAPHEEYFAEDHCWNYRIASAYYFLDEEGPALRYFEKALKARPGDKDTLLWSSIFVTLVAKKYHESVTLPSGLRMVYDNH